MARKQDMGHPTKPGNPSGARKEKDKEAGRDTTGSAGAGRPAGKSSARDSTGVNVKGSESKTTPGRQMPPA